MNFLLPFPFSHFFSSFSTLWFPHSPWLRMGATYHPTPQRALQTAPFVAKMHIGTHRAEQNIGKWKHRCKQTFQQEATIEHCISTSRPSWNFSKQQIDKKKMFKRTTLTTQSKAKHQDLLLAERLDPVATFILSLCSPNSYFFQTLMIPNCENLLNYFAYLI